MNIISLNLCALGDSTKWLGLHKHYVVVAETYQYYMAHIYNLTAPSWFQILWKWSAPLKVIMFFWLVWKQKIPTWDNLLKQGHFGLRWCIFYRQELGMSLHIFILFPTTRQVWLRIYRSIYHL